MFGNESVQRFWRWFEGEQARFEERMHAAGVAGSPIEAAALGESAIEMQKRLDAYSDGIEARYALGRDGACVITFTTGGVEANFDGVFALVDGSPIVAGWEFLALRPRNAPRRFEHAGIAYDLADLRFYYRLGSEKIVIAILADEGPDCDYRLRRAYAAALVAELLGEEDFGRYVADVLLIEYDTWLAATPGGRSAPAAVLGPTFDRIFRRPHSLRRPAINARLRLVS